VTTMRSTATIRLSSPRRAVLPGLCCALLLSGCLGFGSSVPPPSYARYNEYLPCANRIGRCFELKIGGAEVQVIEDEKRQADLASMAGKVSYEIKDLYWEIPAPIEAARAFELALAPAGDGKAILGEQRKQAEITVWALGAEDGGPIRGKAQEAEAIAREQALLKTEAGGAAAGLKPGRYVFEVRYLGKLDWDRKFVLLTLR